MKKERTEQPNTYTKEGKLWVPQDKIKPDINKKITQQKELGQTAAGFGIYSARIKKDKA